MAKALVVFGSKYGSTHEVAQAIADGLEADIANVGSYPDVRPYDLVVIGSPIYGGNYLKAVLDFVRANRQFLAKKKVAAFVTAAADMERQIGLTGEEDNRQYTQQDYADGLAQLAGGQIVGTGGFGGRLVPEQLDEMDRNTLDWFYRFLMNEPLKGFDLLDFPAAHRWGEELRQSISG